MLEKEKITNIIFNAIDVINEILPSQKKISKSTEALLYTDNGGLDSLELTLLIVDLEKKIEEGLGQSVALIDTSGISPEQNPFLSIETLSNHILAILKIG